MSLYESFLLLSMFRVLLHSSSGASDCMQVYCSVSVCTGVLVRFGWSRGVSECRLEHVVLDVNLMSLYESFFIAQHVSNVITFILRSRRLYLGVLFCFGVYRCIGAVRLEQGGIRMQVGALLVCTSSQTHESLYYNMVFAIYKIILIISCNNKYFG